MRHLQGLRQFHEFERFKVQFFESCMVPNIHRLARRESLENCRAKHQHELHKKKLHTDDKINDT